MKKFARIFEIPEADSQLLITVEYEPEDEATYLRFRAQGAEGQTISIGYGYKVGRHNEAEKIMNDYTEREALKMYRQLVKLGAEAGLEI